MDAKYLELSYWKVGLAAALILVNGVISITLRLDLERRLILAAVRTVVQLMLIGLVLGWIFSPPHHWYLVVGMILAMTSVAGLSAVGRSERRYPGMQFDCLVSMALSAWTIGAVALAGIVAVRPWYQPQYAIPLVGMILGNTLTGISLGMDRLTETLTGGRDDVETLLALGADRWEAAHAAIKNAVRTGMIPIINAMMVVGIVALPGMMTGQLLSGVEPAQAVKYQIVIMFLIASGTALGTVSVVLLGYRRLFNARHQFLHGLIKTRKSSWKK